MCILYYIAREGERKREIEFFVWCVGDVSGLLFHEAGLAFYMQKAHPYDMCLQMRCDVSYYNVCTYVCMCVRARECKHACVRMCVRV